MPNDIHAQIDTLFAAIAKLQAEPAHGEGLTGAQKAEHALAGIESMILVARNNRLALEASR